MKIIYESINLSHFVIYKHRVQFILENLRIFFLFRSYHGRDQDFNCTIPEKTVAGQDIFFYNNKEKKFDKLSLIEATIKKYFLRTSITEPVVILTDSSSNNDPLYRNLKKFLSKSKRSVTYLPNHSCKDRLLDSYDHYIKEVEQYLKKPEGFLITNINSFNGAQARNVIIYTKEISTKHTRNLVLRTMSFLIIICETDVKSGYGLKQDLDLHTFIFDHQKGQKILEYKNEHKLENSILSSAIINKYFHDKTNENIIFILNRLFKDGIFQKLQRNFSHQRHVSNFEDITQGNDEKFKWITEIEQKLDISGSILVVEEDLFHSNIETLLLHDINNIVMFARDDTIEDRKFYRNFLMRAKPEFAVVIHEGNIEEINEVIKTYPIDDLHCHWNVGSKQPECFHFKNEASLPDAELVEKVVRKFLCRILENSTVILTQDDNTEAICDELNQVSNQIHAHSCVLSHFSDGHIDLTKVELIPGTILVVKPEYYSTKLNSLPSSNNIIASIPSDDFDSAFLINCRDFILETNPKFSMIIHDEDLDEYFDQILEMKTVEDL